MISRVGGLDVGSCLERDLENLQKTPLSPHRASVREE